MTVRKIPLFIILLAFVSLDALGSDFSALVNKAGDLVSGVGVHQVIRSSRGHYEVIFEHSIKGCHVSGMRGNDQTTPDTSRIVTQLGRNGTNAVLVETRTPEGELADFSFRLNVNCPDPARPPDPLVGYVDLHTHPLANVGFGGKLLYGGVDIGSLLPADPDCNQNVRATSVEQALGHDASTHGLWNPFTNPCGDTIRAGVIYAVEALNDAAPIGPDAAGVPGFGDWPVWNDITHQKMWVDWIERAVDSGLRVMVALGVNNKTLADATAGPCDYPTDDRTSTDLQLAEIKGFVSRHPKLMEIALTADDLARIVRSNRLAVVLGTEIDFFGNLNKVPQPPTNDQLKAEIDRLYSEGVRYMFPIHVLDNSLGGTAAYVDLFNYSTFREMGHYLNLDCASAPQSPDDLSEALNYHFTMTDPTLVTVLNTAGKVKLGTTFPNPPPYNACSKVLKTGQLSFPLDMFPGQPTTAFDTINFIVISAETGLGQNDTATATVQLKNGTSLGPFVLRAQGGPAWGKWTVNGGVDQRNKPISFNLQPAVAASDISQVNISLVLPSSGGASDQWSIEEVSVTLSNSGTMGGENRLARSAFGQRNLARLSGFQTNQQGEFAVKEMMRLGMMIDFDHMSDLSKSDVLSIANGIKGGGYPINSGHSGLRGFFPQGVPRSQGDVNDRSTTVSQYQQIANLHGMAGIGSANLDSYQWAELYLAVLHVMGAGALGFGTDTDGFAPGMPPRCDPPITAQLTDCNTHKTQTSYPFTFGPQNFSFSQSSMSGTFKGKSWEKSWDYDKEGVAHYGMFAEFLRDVATYPDGQGTLGKDVINNLMSGAEYFYQTWKICEAQKANVP